MQQHRQYGCGDQLVRTVGTVGKAIFAILQTVDTLWTRGSVDSSVIVPALCTEFVGLCAVFGIIVDDRLAGNVLGLHTRLGSLGVPGVSSVAGVDKGLETSTLTRVRLHDLLVLVESLGHLLVADIVQKDALAKRGRDGGTELAVTSLCTCVSF